jgi:hypothetical protein
VFTGRFAFEGRWIYGHLFPDSTVKVAAKLDAYLEAVH